MKELLETKFSLYNKYIAKELWALAAVMLWELVSEYDYYKTAGRLLSDWSFYSSINNILDATWLKRKSQETAIKTLEDAWILMKTFNKEKGNKRYFKLNPYKIAEYTKYEWEIDPPLSKKDIPFVPGGHTLCPNGTYPMSPEDIALSPEDIALSQEYNHKQLIIVNNKKNNNNSIGAQKNFCSPDALRASTDTANAETGLSDDSEVKKKEKPKTKRKSQKQKRYEEVITSPEFTATLCRGIESESAQKELISLWGEYVELRCSKDYKAFTDGAVKRNLKVLDWTSLEERKEIISKSVTKWRTGLFPLNDYDKKRLITKEANVEWSDERLYNSILKMNCQEREELIPQGTLHKYLMELCEQYWKDKISDIYYNRVRPEIKSIYGIKRDWVSH